LTFFWRLAEQSISTHTVLVLFVALVLVLVLVLYYHHPPVATAAATTNEATTSGCSFSTGERDQRPDAQAPCWVLGSQRHPPLQVILRCRWWLAGDGGMVFPAGDAMRWYR
jgi:hypothetical protein